MDGYLWLLIDGYLWLTMVIDGYLWLSMVMVTLTKQLLYEQSVWQVIGVE